MTVYKLEKFARAIIYLLAFFSLIIVPGTLWPLVFVPSIIFYILSAILLLLLLIISFKDRYNIIKINVLFWLIFGYIIILVLSAVFGADLKNSFFGFQPRMGGLLSYMALFAWLLSLLFFLKTEERWNFFIKLLVIASVLVVIFSIVSELMSENVTFFTQKGHTAFFANRFAGILGNPIFLAGYLLPHIFLSAILALKENVKKRKIIWLSVSILLTLALFLTQSRGGIFSLLAVFALLAFFYAWGVIKKRERVFSRLLAIIIPFAGLVIYTFLNSSFLSRITQITFTSDTIATRFIIWKIAIKAFLDRWLLGWGPENFSYAFSKFYDANLLKFSFYETWMDKPHNQFLEVFATTGFAGGALFLAIFAVAFVMIYKLIKKDEKNKWIYLMLAGLFLTYAGHLFFAFDTNGLRLVIFAVFAYLIYLYNENFSDRKKLPLNFLRATIGIMLVAFVVALNAIGIKTIKASYYASRAVDTALVNDYSDLKSSVLSLDKIKTPYQNGNWEYLADIFLKTDAFGRLPVTILRDILPPAIRGLEAAVKERPDNFSYNYRLAQMYNLAGNYINRSYADKALEWAAKAEKISPDRQVAGILIGQIYYYKRDLDKGIEVLEKMIEKNPNVAEPFWFLGLLYDAKGEYNKSYAYLTTAVDSGRGLKDLINDEIFYVTVLGRKNDYARMAPVYESIIRKDPTNATWWANIAAVYFELGKYDKARSATRQAIFLDPKFGDEGEDFLKKIDAKEAETK